MGSVVVAILTTTLGVGATMATEGLPEQVKVNTVTSDSALVLAKQNRAMLMASDSVQARLLVLVLGIDRTLCRQVATSERELRECDNR